MGALSEVITVVIFDRLFTWILFTREIKSFEGIFAVWNFRGLDFISLV